MASKAALSLALLSSALFAAPTFGPGCSRPFLSRSQCRKCDGSIAIQTSPGFTGGSVLRFLDANNDGVAD